MLITYPFFYRRFGVRKTTQLTQPPIPKLEVLDLPRNALLHYIGTGPLDDGPTEEENILKNCKRNILIETVPEVVGHLGNPRKMPINPDKLARMHRMHHPRFRPLRGLEMATRDQTLPVVYNYAYLIRMYRYSRNYFSGYFQHKNILDTAFSLMREIAQQSDRQQFIEFDLPKILPSVSMLIQAERHMSTKLAVRFSDNESLAILELWRWFGPMRNESILGQIPDDKLDRINIIFRDSGRWLLFNLGTINKWRQATKTELEVDPNRPTSGFNAQQFQKRFLRMLMTLMDVRSAVVPENLGDEGEKLETPEASSKPSETTVTTEPASTTVQVPTEVPAGKTKEAYIEEVTGYKAPSVSDSHKLDFDLDLLKLHPMEQLEADLLELEKINELAQHETQVISDDIPEMEVADRPKTHQEAIVDHCHALADAGGLSASEYRKLLEAADSFTKITAPDGTSMEQFIEVPKELTQITQSHPIADNPVVVDKTMLQSTLLTFDQKYTQEVLPKDIAAMVANLQQAGIILLDYKVETIHDITGSYDSYTIKLKPLQGLTSTLRFRLPKVDEFGNFQVNGVTYKTRKQRGDLPLRKIRPGRVALTSYYGKTFVDRDEKKVNDYGRWLREAIMSIGLDPSRDEITNLVPGDAFYSEFEAPKLYTTIASGFRQFTLKIKQGETVKHWHMYFDAQEREQHLPEVVLKYYEYDGRRIVGQCDDQFILMAEDSAWYVVDGKLNSDKMEALPSIEEILGLSLLKAPIDFSTVNVSGTAIPAGVVLGYLMGMDRLVKRLRANYRIVPAGQRIQLQEDEWALTFQDETWVFSRDNALATMVLAGWREYDDSTRMFNAHEFNKKDVYFNALDNQGLGVRFLREMDLMNQLFIDPITRELLENMHEPTVFTELILKASQYLLVDTHPHELDAAHMRIKGYERFAGFVYAELIRTVRAHNARSNRNAYPLELNPHAIWFAVMEDPAKNQNSEINPIQNLKELEAVTYSGSGGRSGRTMVKRMRAYHKSDMGVISEATMDSSDVGINTFLSANPQFDSLRGTAKPYKVGESSPTSLLSTSALLAPASTHDAVKRANFISIQNGHGVACEGYHQSSIRTGYESVIGQRTSDLHCFTAKKPGVVTQKNEFGIIVEYSDGKTQGIELGRRYGAAAGLTIPHTVVSDLNAGEKFAVGDTIAYNTGFFEPDVLNPKQVVFKNSMLVNTVLLEAPDTLEDSSAISQKVSRLLRTKTTKVRTIVVDFNQEIHNLVQPGQALEYESILCIIEDAVSAGNQLLNTDSIDTLRVLSSQAPQAKVKGVVERVEIYYNGEVEDMGRTLREHVAVSDKQLSKRHKSAGRPAFTGSVDDSFRIENEPLLLDTAAIRVYITSDVEAGVGDKGVFGNQLKTVFGRVFEKMETQSGAEIDAIFGAKSVDDRIVTSPYVIGTTNVLLELIAKKAIKAYRGS